jgi:hypothetical protein
MCLSWNNIYFFVIVRTPLRCLRVPQVEYHWVSVYLSIIPLIKSVKTKDASDLETIKIVHWNKLQGITHISIKSTVFWDVTMSSLSLPTFRMNVMLFPLD